MSPGQRFPAVEKELPFTGPTRQILRNARQLAKERNRNLTSIFLLASFVTSDNEAAFLLEDQGISASEILDCARDSGSEPAVVTRQIFDRSRDLFERLNCEAIDCFCLFSALLRTPQARAHRILDEFGVDLKLLRTTVRNFIGQSDTGRHRAQSRDPTPQSRQRSKSADYADSAPSQIGIHPSLNTSPAAGQTQNKSGPDTLTDSTIGGADTRTIAPGQSQDESPKSETRAEAESGEGESGQTDESTGFIAQAKQTAKKLGNKIFGKSEPPDSEQKPSEPDSEAGRPTREMDAVDSPSGTSSVASPPDTDDAPDEPSASATVKLDAQSDSWSDFYQLDPEEFPYLTEYGRNLTLDALAGEIDPVLCRQEEKTELTDILGKRRANNPILIGEPGVGKTAIVEGLASDFVELAKSGNAAGERTIVEIDFGQLVSGTHLRGSLSERLVGIKQEVRRAGGDVIVFLDEIHRVFELGDNGDGPNAAGELKTALARGQFPCIGATTSTEYRRHVEQDGAMARRFQEVLVEEPDEQTALEILNGIRQDYASHHGVEYTDDALRKSVRLGQRYLYDKRLPDKAIGLLDLAGSRASRSGKPKVDGRDVQQVVSRLADVPIERLSGSRKKRFLRMEEFVRQRFIGHESVVSTVCDVIRRNYAGFRGQRPIGSLLFLGPTGVGKTELAKVLADFLFHDRDALVRIDMSEFREAHSVSRMIGSPPGYVGFDQGGELTEQVRRRPYQIVLLDEIEKAHPDVLNLLLQILEEGELSDGRGAQVDFSHTVIVLTSNLGAETFEEKVGRQDKAPIGFSSRPRQGRSNASFRDAVQQTLDAARSELTPELWNRLDEKCVFKPLARTEIKQIARLQLAESRRKLERESQIELDFADELLNFLIDNGGYDPELGARPMRQAIERYVEAEVARYILERDPGEGVCIRVDVRNGQIHCREV